MKEPTILYLMKDKENSSKLKSTICYMISLLLENSHI